MKRHVLALVAPVLVGACTATSVDPSPAMDPGPGVASGGATTPVFQSRALPDLTSTGATVLDFESLAASGTGLTFVPSYSQDGFTIANPAYSADDAFGAPRSDNPMYQGSTALVNNMPDGTAVLTRDDGEAFAAVSIDIAELSPSDLTPRTVPFTGTRADGSTVAATLTTDGAAGFQTFTLEGFTDLVSLSWVQVSPFHQFDNIVLAPAALGPRNKDDCWKGGWKPLGFANQGQCIRMVETGKDSR